MEESKTRVLVPAHARHFMDRLLDAGLGLFLFYKLRKLLLGGSERGRHQRNERTVPLPSRRTCPLERMGGTLTCEAGYVVDDETCGQKPPSEPHASVPSLSSDGHGSCKPRVPHLTPFFPQSLSLSFPLMASSSTRSPDQSQYSAYTNVWQPNQRTPYVPKSPTTPSVFIHPLRKLIECSPVPPNMSPGRLSR